MTPKPTADQQTVEALRGVLRQIADKAQIGRSTSFEPIRARAINQIEDLARRALAGSGERRKQVKVNATIRYRNGKPRSLGRYSAEDVRRWLAGRASRATIDSICNDAEWIALKLGCTPATARNVIEWCRESK